MLENKFVVLSAVAVTLLLIVVVAVSINPAVGIVVGLALTGVASVVRAIRGAPADTDPRAGSRPRTRPEGRRCGRPRRSRGCDRRRAGSRRRGR